ncbi:hypothetical protein QN400_23525 [Pseudomonas sp. RTC3]|uniref:hypothetical protein n=1 Tax=Pseudomonas sp. 5C2 TaxID=3048588 RepID=UPI002AB5784D|nr:hypothetical protein [Pseudomonas sp. 5C2]MDY7566250.1 hypothetical protein [Pseudomonas sp. 5C2]MEB0064985.1 hypothetical protein [Pseudomonas sp. RTC3]MEB0243559.1 hypothetical protein [Pseudomonas sp. 5C2]
MRFHFVLDGLSHEQTNSLLSIESAMTGRSATAVFNLKTLDVFTSRDPEKAKAFVSGKLGAFLMDSLEALMAATGLDLINLYHVVKGVPVVLTTRRM